MFVRLCSTLIVSVWFTASFAYKMEFVLKNSGTYQSHHVREITVTSTCRRCYHYSKDFTFSKHCNKHHKTKATGEIATYQQKATVDFGSLCPDKNDHVWNWHFHHASASIIDNNGKKHECGEFRRINQPAERFLVWLSDDDAFCLIKSMGW